MNDSKQCGFTLVELLVVVAIIAILVALLLPAVQAAREAARRSQCSNNFKQIGLAFHNYHTAMGTFPYGQACCEPTNPEANCGNSKCNCQLGQSTFYSLGWDGLILPYLEYGALHDQFDINETPYQIYSGINRQVRDHPVATYLCPSDPQQELEFSGQGQGWKTNVGGVCDTQTAWQSSSGPGQHPIMHGNGMLLNILAKKVRDVYDGTSSTLFVGEITGGEEGTTYG